MSKVFKKLFRKKDDKPKRKSANKSSSVSKPEVHKTGQKQNSGLQYPASKQRGSPSNRPFEGQPGDAAKNYHEESHQGQARGVAKDYHEESHQGQARGVAKDYHEESHQGQARGAPKDYHEKLQQGQARGAPKDYHEKLQQGQARGAPKDYHEKLQQGQARGAPKNYHEKLQQGQARGAPKDYHEKLQQGQARGTPKDYHEKLQQGHTKGATKPCHEELYQGQNRGATPQYSTSAKSVVLNKKPIGKTVSQQTPAKQQKVGVDSLLPLPTKKLDVPLLQESRSSNSEKGDKKSLQQLIVDLHHREPLGQKLEKNNSQYASAVQQPRAAVHQEPSQNFEREKLHFTPDNVSAEQVDTGSMMNLKFYQAKIPCQPRGVYIDEIHKWKGNYERLERDHRYIQWLFPIPESHGRNPEAFQLTPHEAEEIKKDKLAFERFLLSYEMMLDFYGMKLDRVTGQLSRSRYYNSRIAHLNGSRHNYMRITRILICLGEFGLENYQRQFILFLLNEAFVERTLEGTQDSCFNFWIPTVRDDGEREKLEEHVAHLCSRWNTYRRNKDKLRHL